MPACDGHAPPSPPLECRYAIKCKQLDCAVSPSKAVAFTHWRSVITPQGAGAGGGNGTFTIDGVEVDVFGPDGRIKDIWCVRGRRGVRRRRTNRQSHPRGAGACQASC